MAQVKDRYPKQQTGVGQKDAKRGFPSHFVKPDIKQKAQWCMEYVRAMHWEYRGGTGPALFRNVANKYKEWRDYARGQQEIDQYKEMLGPKKKRNRGKQDTSWKNLDWSVLPIAPKFVQILQGMILAEPRIVKVRAIDSESLESERLYENNMSEWVTNRDWIQKLQQTHPSMQMDSPVDQDDPEPQNLGEVPLYKDLFYKDRAAMELKDTLDVAFEVNNMEHLRKEIVEDIIEVGVGGTRTLIDSNGFFKIRRVVPERIIINQCKFQDFRDKVRIGEYIEMTISELKQLAGNQFTEKEYKEMANMGGKNKTFGQGAFTTDYYEETYTYPYDHEKITILDAEWFSDDERTTKISKDRFGNPQRERVSRDFLPKGVSDDMYKEEHKGERYIVRRKIKNRYRAMWVVDTDFIFNFGLATDMARQAGSLADTELSYQLYTTNFDSIMRRIIPALDQIQINWLQFQNHVARSRPAGLSIEMSALENLSMGKGKERMTPKEALRLYFDTGILVWRMKQWSGASAQWRPVDELNNGLNDAAAQHFQNIIGLIDILRNILGLNQVQDASTPNPDIGKFVTETASQATAHALTYIYHAEKEIYERTAKAGALLLPDIIKRGKSKGLIEALGTKTFNFFQTNMDLTHYEFSLKIETGPTQDQQVRMAQYIQASLEKQEISTETAVMLENEQNPYKQVALLRHHKRLRREEAQADQQAVAKMEEEKNINSANAAAEAEMEKNKDAHVLDMEKIEKEGEVQMMVDTNKQQGEIILAKINNGADLTETEKEIAGRITETRIKIKSQEKIAQIGAQAQVKAAKETPKMPTPAAKKPAKKSA